jgi:hypothetical protein
MEAVDHYCERTDPGIWAEPLNALTNLAFILAALLLWRDARSLNRLDGDIMLLLAWAVAFGIGSFLFHTMASTITLWLDVLPIFFFVLTYLWLSVRRVLRWGHVAALASAGIFLIAQFASGQFSHVLHGALFYAPTALLLIALTIAYAQRRKQAQMTMVAATAAFLAALLFRTIDQPVCPIIPVGTHYLWHLFTATTVYLATRALLAGESGSLGPQGGPSLNGLLRSW